MKIAGLVLIPLAILATVFVTLALTTTLFPCVASLIALGLGGQLTAVVVIIASGCTAALITGIVLTVLGFKKQERVEEYLDNCPYYQGLTQMLNGDHEKAAEEFLKYGVEKENSLNETIDMLDQEKFNKVNGEIKLATIDDFNATLFYYKACLTFKIRDYLIRVINKELLNHNQKNLYSRFVKNYNAIKRKVIDYFPKVENNLKIVKDITFAMSKDNKTDEDVNKFKSLIIPSIKTTPDKIKITLRA